MKLFVISIRIGSKQGKGKAVKKTNWCLILIFTDGVLYTGTVADFSGMDPIIYREPLQTEQYDSMSLNGKEAFFYYMCVQNAVLNACFPVGK